MRQFIKLFWKGFFVIALTVSGGHAALASTFSDVPDDHSYSAAINYLAEQGIVIGYTDSTFKPDQSINRAEWLKMLSVGLSLQIDSTTVTNFPDVPEESWFAQYVRTASSHDIVSGYPDGFFRPEQTVNHVESLKMLLLAGDITVTQPIENPTLDVSADAWFAPYVATALEKNIIEVGVSANIEPEKEMTRGETALLLYRLLKSRENEGIYNLSELWDTYDFPTVFTSVKVPEGWQIIEEAQQVVLWSQDTTNHQVSYVRTTDDSGAIVIVHDANSAGLSEEEYFASVTAAAPSEATITETTHWGDVPAIAIATTYDDYTTVDLYAYLDDGSVAILYSTYGHGIVGAQRGRKIAQILNSFRPIAGSTDTRPDEEILAQARANIAIDGKGTETLGWFSDKMLISTDTIGVGTGPVDYYYSPSFNITLKYERSFDVILDIQEGQTDAF